MRVLKLDRQWEHTWFRAGGRVEGSVVAAADAAAAADDAPRTRPLSAGNGACVRRQPQLTQQAQLLVNNATDAVTKAAGSNLTTVSALLPAGARGGATQPAAATPTAKATQSAPTATQSAPDVAPTLPASGDTTAATQPIVPAEPAATTGGTTSGASDAAPADTTTTTATTGPANSNP